MRKPLRSFDSKTQTGQLISAIEKIEISDLTIIGIIFQSLSKKGADQTARMPKLIWKVWTRDCANVGVEIANKI